MLLTKATLLGLKDNQAIVPLLLAGKGRGIQEAYINDLLRELRIDECDYHPGVTLWVRTLGPFAIWRGDTAVSSHEWQREKARQLFQLLVTCRGQWLTRDQIADRLWPDLPADSAVRDFKVALNALNHTLEPGRPRNAQPFFVLRNDAVYGLNPAACIRVDADEFEELTQVEDDDPMLVYNLRQALALYEDDYLPECAYEDWPAAERERLRHLYLAAANRLARRLVETHRWDEAVNTCNGVLARDNCWEPGYRYIMQSYAGKGNLPEIQNTYNRCGTILQQEMDIQPSAETRRLFRQLVGQRN